MHFLKYIPSNGGCCHLLKHSSGKQRQSVSELLRPTFKMDVYGWKTDPTGTGFYKYRTKGTEWQLQRENFTLNTISNLFFIAGGENLEWKSKKKTYVYPSVYSLLPKVMLCSKKAEPTSGWGVFVTYLGVPCVTSHQSGLFTRLRGSLNETEPLQGRTGRSFFAQCLDNQTGGAAATATEAPSWTPENKGQGQSSFARLSSIPGEPCVFATAKT